MPETFARWRAEERPSCAILLLRELSEPGSRRLEERACRKGTADPPSSSLNIDQTLRQGTPSTDLLTSLPSCLVLLACRCILRCIQPASAVPRFLALKQVRASFPFSYARVGRSRRLSRDGKTQPRLSLRVGAR